ncbi:MAG: hypothetical protein ABIZ80_12670 [Bryobacteraceae bacterium]
MGCNRQMTDEDAEVMKEAAAVTAVTGESQAKAEQYVRMYGEEGAKAKLLAERAASILQAPNSVLNLQPLLLEAPWRNDVLNSKFWCEHVEERVVEVLEEVPGMSVINQEEVVARRADGTCYLGRVDLLFDEKHVVELKSDTMSNWTVSKARELGKKYAEQVLGYIEGPTLVGRDGEGYLYMIGRLSGDSSVNGAFEEAVASVSSEIKVVYVQNGGTPEQITRMLYDTFNKK